MLKMLVLMQNRATKVGATKGQAPQKPGNSLELSASLEIVSQANLLQFLQNEVYFGCSCSHGFRGSV